MIYDIFLSKFVTPIFAELRGAVDIYTFFKTLVKNEEVLWTYKNENMVKMYYKNIRFNLVLTKFENEKSVLEFIILEETDKFTDLYELFKYMCEHQDTKEYVVSYTKITKFEPLFKFSES